MINLLAGWQHPVVRQTRFRRRARRLDRSRPRQVGAGREGRWRMRDLARPIERDAKVSIVTSRDPDALELLRHDAAHVLAQAVQELYPGTQITFGPATERTASTTTSRAPSRSRRRISRRSRSGCGDRRPRPADRARGLGPRQAEEVLRRPRRELQGGVVRGAAGGRGDHGLSPGHMAGHVQRPAPALDGQARQGVQADARLRRVLARRRQERPAAAHLRHDLLQRQGAEGVPHAARGSGETRPSPHRQGDGALPSAGRSRRHGVLASQGLAAVAHAGGVPAQAARRRRLRRGQDATAGRSPAVGGVGPLGEVPREHVHLGERGRPARLYGQPGRTRLRARR